MGDEAWRRLAAEAVRRCGLFTIGQAEAIGVDRKALRRRIRQGTVDRLPGDLFRIVGTPDSWEQRACAATLRFPDSALSHRSAAHLWRLDGFMERPALVELKVLRGTVSSRVRRGLEGVRVYETRVNLEVSTARGFRVTSMKDTLEDLAGLHMSNERLEIAVDCAQRLNPAVGIALEARRSARKRGQAGSESAPRAARRACRCDDGISP